MRGFAVIAALLGVSACGGGGGGTSVTSTTPLGPPELLANIAEQERIANLILINNGSNAAAFAAETAPVVFNGVMILDQAAGVASPTYYGDMAATVDFGAQSLTGNATNFIFFDDSAAATQGTPVGGTLTLSAAPGSVIPDDPNTSARDEFTVTIGGSLDLVGSGTTSVTGSNVGGAFAGPTAAGTSPNDTASDINWFAARGTTDLGTTTFETLIVGER